MTSKKTPIPRALIPDNASFAGGLESEDLSFRQAIRTVRKRIHIVLWTMLVAGALTLVVSILLRSYYSSVATIEIEKKQSDPLEGSLGSLASSLGGSDDVKTELQTEVSILQSEALGIETIEQTKFEEHQNKGWHLFGYERSLQERGLPLRDAPIARERLLKKFEDHLTIATIPDTRLIQVTFEDPDPKFAADTTNALIERYTQDRLARRNSSTVQATGWMSGEIDDLNKQVQASEQRLIDYQRQSGLIVVPAASSSGQGQSGGGGGTTVTSPVLDRLTQLNTSLITAEANRITQEALYQLAKSGDVDGLTSMASGMQSSGTGGGGPQSEVFSGLLALRQQQTSLKLQLTSALQAYGPKNPHLIDLDKQLGTINQEIKEEGKRIVNTTEMNYQLALKAEDGIRKAYEVQEQEAYKMNDAQIRLAVLQQEADSTRALYQDLYTKLQESKLSEGTQSSNISVVSGALPPAQPLHPKRPMNVAIGLAGGLFLGLIATFVLDTLDDSVVTSIEVENLTGVPVLGSIPRFDRPPSSTTHKTPQGSPPRAAKGVQIGGLDHQSSEAYRALRTTLLLSQAGSPPRTLLLTSSLSEDGKTTTTYNLAACFAMLGTRTLAIDADMRGPSLHRRAGQSNSQGLSNLLTSASDPTQVILQDTDVKNLFILTSGPIPPNPAELLGSKAFDELLEKLSSQYDLVLIDSPPGLVVADASIMSAKVDGVVVVVRSSKTTRPALVRIVENFRRTQANLLGFVLNAVDTKSAEYYYAHGYYGRDNYGEDDHDERKS